MTQPPPGSPGPWPSTDQDERPGPEASTGRSGRWAGHVGTIIAIGAGAAVLFVVALVLIFLAVTDEEEDIASAGNRVPPPSSSDPYPVPPAEYSPHTTSEPSSKSGSASVSGKILELEKHPLLQDANAGLPNLVCALPSWHNDPETAKAFFRAATGCLNAAWEPLLRRFDLPFTPPDLLFPTGDRFQSDCGTISVGIGTAAYYCEGELFLPYHGLQIEQYGDNPGVYLALIAHEYGHHVQEVAGIMDAAWERIYAAGEHTETGQELSRRKELQAQCFSGMFLGSHVDRGGSITRDMYNEAWEDQETRGDDTSGGHDHGNNENYAAWWRAGAVDNRIGDCNTFAADSAEVR